MSKSILLAAPLWLAAACSTTRADMPSDDVLPSWRPDLPSVRSIREFVARVTTHGGSDFVPVDERIAVFDNDGTLWSEQPNYVQFAFALDRVKQLAPQHPEWKENEPFQSLLAGDMKAFAATGEKGIVEVVTATHSGMSTDEFAQIVDEWIANAKHPKTKMLYTEMVYQPMRELLDFLRANGFKTYIVSGGGVEFMRPWAERVYGIPPEQVVGSRGKLKFEMQGGEAVIQKLPEIDLVDDGPGKPVGIQQMIGRRPTMAFGNSDGDLQMLQWTTGGSGPRFGALVHHTDGVREVAYDRESSVGKLDKALDEAPKRGWLLIDMKRDWKIVYPAK